MRNKTRQMIEEILLEGFMDAEAQDKITGFKTAIELMSTEQLEKLADVLGAGI